MDGDFRKRYAQETVKEQSVDITLIKRLLSYLYPYCGIAAGALLLLLIAKMVEAWVPIQIGYLAQKILMHLKAPMEEQRAFYAMLVSAGGSIIGWIFFSFLCESTNIFLKNKIGLNALLALRMNVYEHILRLPISYHDGNAVGRMMTRTIHDVDQINQLFTESLIPIIGSLFLFASMLGGLFYMNWHVGLMILVIAPALWWLTHHFREKQRRGYQAIRSVLSAMNTFIQEHLMGMGIIKGFNLHEEESKKFTILNEDLFSANLETIHHFSFFFSGVEWIQSLTMILVFALLAVLAPSEGGFQVSTYLTLSLYSMMIFRPLADLAERYNVLQSALAGAERLFEILDTPVESLGPQPGRKLERIESIKFDNLWFAYQGEHWVLKGLNLAIDQGKSAALIGMTGAGKSSVMNLLLRFYDFQKGHLWINGHDIREYAVQSVRKQFSVILQDPVMFSGTVEDNIALYDSKIGREQVMLSAEAVHLYPLVQRLPGQFQFKIGERGRGLSVGEMQLISLARAMAHQRSVVIFDEATSNIDHETEQMIQKALHAILRREMALVIAHRLSTIRDVSRIFVLAEGVVEEEGTHEELMAYQGLYEKLYRLQFNS